jgi:aminoglycoside 2'-N-acetyltransferase I
MTPRIDIKHTSELTPAENSAVASLDKLAFFGDPWADFYQWAEADWRVLVYEGNELVSTLEIVERNAKAGTQPVFLGGIGGVCTHPDCRGRGLASLAMQAAAEFMRQQLKVEFGLLMCDIKRIHLYGSLGWQVINGALYFDQPGGKVMEPGTTMMLICGNRPWPGGDVDLCGLPF